MGAAYAVEDSAMDNNLTATSGDAVTEVESVDNLLSAQTHEISGDYLQDIKNDFNDSADINPGNIKYSGNDEYASGWSNQQILTGGYTFNANDVDETSQILKADITISGDTFDDIQTAINGAIAGDIIYLSGITYTNNLNNAISIGKSITIIGTGGTVLDAEGKSRIFTITNMASNVNMQGITFVNGNADNGGALYISGGCNNFGVSDCVFKDNTATANGGAIATENGWNPNGLTITECMFIDNSAPNANDIFATGSGNQISDSSFTGKTDFNASKESLSLTLNLAADLGNSIKGNFDKSNLSYWDGSSKIPVEITEGTKINLENKDITLEIHNPDGTLNKTVTGVTDNYGQYTYDYSEFPIDEYTYKATYMGGVSPVTSEGNLYDNVITGNTFSDIQSAINSAEAGSTLYLKGITYTNNLNNAISIGKGITLIGSDGTVLDGEGKSGIVDIASQVSNVNLEGITFVNGNAEKGGALYIPGGCNNIAVTGCVFKNNNASARGGAISTSGADEWTPSGLTITECMFIGNSAPNANDIFTAGQNHQVSDSSFSGSCDLTAETKSQSLTINLATNLGNCINGIISKNNLSYWDGTSKIPVEITKDTKFNLAGKDISLEIYNPDGTLNRTVPGLTDNDGNFVYDYSDIPVGEYTYNATYMNGDSKIQKKGKLYDMVSGNTFADIQSAINSADAGSTLYLNNITYTNDNHGEILINKAITLIGSYW